MPGAFKVICLAIALMFLAGRGRGDRMSAADVRVWHEPADPECPLSRRVLEGKRTCHGDRESDVHDNWMARLVALRSAVLEIFSFETYSTAQNLAIDQTTSGFEHGKFREAAGCYPAKIEF